METFNQIITFLSKLFEWWFVVMPWERAVFVRGGRPPKLLSGGMYLRIPFVDRIYIQSSRLRSLDLPVQTVSTKDGKTITLKAMVSYNVSDMLLMFNTISHPEMTMGSIVMAAVSDVIHATDSSNISPSLVEIRLTDEINASAYGLGEFKIRLVSWAEVKTFRLIQDSSWMAENLHMRYLGEK